MDIERTDKAGAAPIIISSSPSKITRFGYILSSVLTALGFQPLLLLVQAARIGGGNLSQGLAKQLADGLTKIFNDAVVADKRGSESLDRVTMHARAYADLQFSGLIILQMFTISKYIAFFILIGSLKNSLHTYYYFSDFEADPCC